MDAGEMALAIAFELDDESWTAEGYDLGEVHLTNENGEKFVLTVEAVDEFPGGDA